MDHRHNLNFSLNKISPSMITEERILSLRKKAIKNKLISNKIKEAIENNNTHSEKAYEIKIADLSFQEENSKALINQFYEEQSQDKQIEMAISMINPQMLNSDLKQFGIKQIRNWLQTLLFKGNQSLNQVERLITEATLDNLVLIIFQNPQNPKVLFETSYILVYLTHLPAYTNLLAKHINHLYQFLKAQSDQIVIKQLLWVFNHLILESEEYKKKICAQCDIVAYVCNIIEAHDSNVISLNAMAFWIFGTLLKGELCLYLIQEKCIRIIPIVARYIRSQLDKNVFKESLRALKRFLKLLFDNSIINTALLNMITALKLPHYLSPFLSLKDTSANNKNAIISIFISLVNLTEDYDSAEEIVDKEVICHLEDVLRYINNSEKVKKNYINSNSKFFNKILRLIEIFSSKKMPTSIKKTVVRKTKVCSELIELAHRMPNPEYEIKLMRILNNFINSDSKMIITHMIVIGLHDLLNDSLEESSVPEILLLSMNGIEIMIKYGVDIVKNQNFILVYLELKNCGGKLEKLLSHSNEKVVAYANYLLQEYFNSNKVNNN